MASTPKWYDRVMASSTTTGTGTYTLGSAITGYQAWSVLGDGNSAYYCAMEVDANGNPSGDWEIGLGTYTASGTTLSRDTILASTNSNNAVSWAAGTRRIFLTLPAGVTSAPLISPVLSISLVGAKHIRVLGSNLSTGDNDLYTVPTGKRAFIHDAAVYNTSAGTIAHYLQAKVSGTYYRMATAANVLTGASSAVANAFMLEAGDILAINTATNNGLNVSVRVTEFDAASPLKQGRLLGPSSGDNTLYTCPSGKSATLISGNMLVSTTSHVVFISDSGGTRNYYLHNVASGGSPASTNRISASAAVSASNRSVSSVSAASLGPGDFININIDTGAAGEVVFAFVLEI